MPLPSFPCPHHSRTQCPDQDKSRMSPFPLHASGDAAQAYDDGGWGVCEGVTRYTNQGSYGATDFQAFISDGASDYLVRHYGEDHYDETFNWTRHDPASGAATATTSLSGSGNHVWGSSGTIGMEWGESGHGKRWTPRSGDPSDVA